MGFDYRLRMWRWDLYYGSAYLQPAMSFRLLSQGPGEWRWMWVYAVGDPNKITTWHSHDNLPHPPPLFTTTVAIAEEYTPFTAAAEEDTSPPPMTVSQDAPPPPPPQTTAMICPCSAGPCSIGTAKNNHNFYSCSVLLHTPPFVFFFPISHYLRSKPSTFLIQYSIKEAPLSVSNLKVHFRSKPCIID